MERVPVSRKDPLLWRTEDDVLSVVTPSSKHMTVSTVVSPTYKITDSTFGQFWHERLRVCGAKKRCVRDPFQETLDNREPVLAYRTGSSSYLRKDCGKRQKKKEKKFGNFFCLQNTR